ncbi:MAG: hypothetical protein HY042_00170, partial [Spirochaetia bacterium]|nr:hypothetical protein [Spirochaetia bacterium]
VTSKKQGILTRSREYGAGVIGVVVEKAALVLSAPDEFLPDDPQAEGLAPKPKGTELVALSGVVSVRVRADKNGVEPGDLLVSSANGAAEKYTGQNYKPGIIFARSLGELRKGEGMVNAVLLPG